MPLNYRIIGQRVKEARLQKQMSQAVLAEQIDMSVTYISHIETARKQASLESLVRMANILGVTVDYFLNGNQINDTVEYQTDLADLFKDCTSYERRIIYKTAFAVKTSLHDDKWLLCMDNQL